MIENEVKYFEFEEPIRCLMIAASEDEAAFAYENDVSGCQEAFFEELSQLEFIERLAAVGMEAIPTIERGIRRAAIDIQNALYLLKETGDQAIVLSTVSLGV